MVNFIEIIERIKNHLCLSADSEVAQIFDLSPQDFSKRKKRGSLLPLIVNWAIDNNVNIDWLVTGKGDKYIKEGAGQGEGDEAVDVEHDEIIKRFLDKKRARDANMALLKIEALDREAFIEAVGYIKGVANNLAMSAKDEPVGGDQPAAMEKKLVNE